MQGRLIIRGSDDSTKAIGAGVKDAEKKFSLEEMVGENIIFAATGITQGPILDGVKLGLDRAVTHSMLMRSGSGTFRFIEGHHDFLRKFID